MQTKTQSLIESCANVLIGYIVAVISQLAIFPLFGINVAFGDNLLIGVYFTIISLARSYCLRRLFNKVNNTNFLWNGDNEKENP